MRGDGQRCRQDGFDSDVGKPFSQAPLLEEIGRLNPQGL